ncbi:unnamed protein product [Caretta caretta]
MPEPYANLHTIITNTCTPAICLYHQKISTYTDEWNDRSIDFNGTTHCQQGYQHLTESEEEERLGTRMRRCKFPLAQWRFLRRGIFIEGFHSYNRQDDKNISTLYYAKWRTTQKTLIQQSTEACA